MIEKFKNKKMSKWKLFLILVLVGNISFYFQERAKWIIMSNLIKKLMQI